MESVAPTMTSLRAGIVVSSAPTVASSSTSLISPRSRTLGRQPGGQQPNKAASATEGASSPHAGVRWLVTDTFTISGKRAAPLARHLPARAPARRQSALLGQGGSQSRQAANWVTVAHTAALRARQARRACRLPAYVRRQQTASSRGWGRSSRRVPPASGGASLAGGPLWAVSSESHAPLVHAVTPLSPDRTTAATTAAIALPCALLSPPLRG